MKRDIVSSHRLMYREPPHSNAQNSGLPLALALGGERLREIG